MAKGPNGEPLGLLEVPMPDFFFALEPPVLPPFKLKHGVANHHFGFSLAPELFTVVRSRADLALRLKCFHVKDKHRRCRWPLGVSLEVNRFPLTLVMVRLGHQLTRVY